MRPGTTQPTSPATRPLYQPQLPHTVWGNFELLQRGQTLADGAPSFQAAAMWLRPFIFDFFFLGTGIACSSFARHPGTGHGPHPACQAIGATRESEPHWPGPSRPLAPDRPGRPLDQSRCPPDRVMSVPRRYRDVRVLRGVLELHEALQRRRQFPPHVTDASELLDRIVMVPGLRRAPDEEQTDRVLGVDSRHDGVRRRSIHVCCVKVRSCRVEEFLGLGEMLKNVLMWRHI